MCCGSTGFDNNIHSQSSADTSRNSITRTWVKKMFVLGISSLDLDATASLVEDGRVIASAAEERFSRIKQHSGFPLQSVKWLLSSTGTTTEQIDAVTYPFFSPLHENLLMGKGLFWHNIRNLTSNCLLREKMAHLVFSQITLMRTLRDHLGFDRMLKQGLEQLALGKKLIRVPHHMAHASSAFYPSGYDRAIVVTLDAYGGGLAGQVCLATSGDGMDTLHQFRFPNSMGHFYGQVTEALGFRSNRHEGKILGLAAFGDKSRSNVNGRTLEDMVRSRLLVKDGDLIWWSGVQSYFSHIFIGDAFLDARVILFQ